MAGREGKCRECGATMIWAKMIVTAKSNPLDVDQVPADAIQAQKGQIAYNEKTGGATSVTGANASEIRRWHAAGQCTVHLSHWATCPERAKIRAETDAKRRTDG